MEKENIFMWMELCMKETGSKINSMDREQNNGLMEVNIKENIKMDKKKAKEDIAGQMGVVMKDNGYKIK